MNMRQDAHAIKCPIEKEPECKLSCEIPQVCYPVIDLFLADIMKTKQSIVITKLQNVVKRGKRKSDCCTCDRSLYVPVKRKKCVICGDIFCSNCSSKNLVVYYPRGAVQQIEIEKGKVQPMVYVTAPGIDISTITEVWRNYRTCSPCEKRIEHVLRVFYFNSSLQDRHHQLVDLEGQILATLDRALESQSQENELHHSASMDDLDQIADERVILKLFNRYRGINYFVRTQLEPVTQTQQRLHKNVLAATTSFYVDKRFRMRYDSKVPKTSTDDRPDKNVSV